MVTPLAIQYTQDLPGLYLQCPSIYRVSFLSPETFQYIHTKKFSRLLFACHMSKLVILGLFHYTAPSVPNLSMLYCPERYTGCLTTVQHTIVYQHEVIA